LLYVIKGGPLKLGTIPYQPKPKKKCPSSNTTSRPQPDITTKMTQQNLPNATMADLKQDMNTIQKGLAKFTQCKIESPKQELKFHHRPP